MIQSQYENVFQQKAPELKEDNPEQIERIRKLARRSINSNFSINGFERNLLFQNVNGKKFREVSAMSGIDSISDARSFSLIDWDLDGTQDVVIKNLKKQMLEAYQNIDPNKNHRVAFRLTGTKSNRDAIGARLLVHTPLGLQMKQVRSAFGFVSQNQREVYFGLGAHQTISKLEIVWPSGLKEEFSEIPSGGFIEIKEGEQKYHFVAFRPTVPLTEDPPLLIQETPEDQQKIAPEFSKFDQNGNKIDSATYFKEKPTVLIFMTSWCVTCKRDIKILNSLENRPYQVLLVHVRTPEEPPLDFPKIEKHSLIGDYDSMLYFKYFENANTGFPVRFWISPEGRILQKTLSGLEEMTLDQEYQAYFQE